MMKNYRNHDPTTSVLSGQRMEASGTSVQQRIKCFDAVVQTPGLTAREIEDRLGIKAHKRLPELRDAGDVYNGSPRVCTISGRLAMTWQPTFPKTPDSGDRP